MKRKIRTNMTMFDFLKGMGMIMVIIVHSMPDGIQDGSALDNVLDLMRSFLMPMFFIISGFWMKDKEWKSGVLDSKKQLLIPYGYATGAILLVSLVHRGLLGAWQEWLDVFLIPMLLGYSGTRMGALWFMVALYLAWSVFYITSSVKDERIRTGIFVALGILGGAVMPLRVPFQLSQGMIAAFFVYCGYVIKKKKLLTQVLSVPVTLALLAAWGIGNVFCTMDFALYRVEGGFFSVLCSLAGSYLIIYWGVTLNRFENRFMDAIRSIGRYTMQILCVHSVEVAVVPWKVLFPLTGEDTVMRVVVQFVLRGILIFVIIWFLREGPARLRRFGHER